jgi:hypothetical protein
MVKKLVLVFALMASLLVIGQSAEAKVVCGNYSYCGYVILYYDQDYQGGAIRYHYTPYGDCATSGSRMTIGLNSTEKNNASSVQFVPSYYPSKVPHCNVIGVVASNGWAWEECIGASDRGINWFGEVWNDKLSSVYIRYSTGCYLNY